MPVFIPASVFKESEEEKREILRRIREHAEDIRRAYLFKKVREDTLYDAICANQWDSAKAFLTENPSYLTATITYSGKTILHVAALFGHVNIVKDLVELVASDHLKTVDAFGNTPLLIATITGATKVAECLVNKNSDILGIANSTHELPVTLAFLNAHQEMGRYLYSVTPLECLRPDKGPLGPTLLRCCLQMQYFDVALDLLGRCEELLFVFDDKAWKPIYGIATMNSAIPSRSELVFWKRWIYDYINASSTPSFNHVRLPIQQEDTGERDQGKLTRPEKYKKFSKSFECSGLTLSLPVAAGHHLLQRLFSSIYNFIGIKKIQELKLLHAQADEILRLVCKNARNSDQVSAFADALFLAAKEGNVEFVFQVSKANPEMLFLGDNSFQNIFCYAVKYRQATVFNLIHGLHFKDVVATNKDKDGNTLLHVAATMAPDTILNRIYGPTLQMQRELQWFKEVERLIPLTIRVAQNNDGKTAEELFRESHKELMKQGEKWIKATASSCSVVGALIVTIMFAAAFTVPGGNDQTFGYPLFIKEPFFQVFILSTVLSLLSSSTSVLMFLAILTSHYSEEKFLRSIPTKLIFGLSFLFISIVTMIIAFLSTIRLMLKHTNYSSGLLPVIILASVPIALFVSSQFPLLLHSAVSTYGNTLNRKVESWP